LKKWQEPGQNREGMREETDEAAKQRVDTQLVPSDLQPFRLRRRLTRMQLPSCDLQTPEEAMVARELHRRIERRVHFSA